MDISALLLIVTLVQASPSPEPLKTIIHVRSSPFCNAFTQNIKHSVEGVLLNDDLIQRTNPVFLKAANDMVSGGALTSSFNSTRPASTSANNDRTYFDMMRLRDIGAAIIHNLQTIDKLLNDPAYFPKDPKTDEDLQLVLLRAELLSVAKKQNDEVNSILGTSDQYLLDTLYSADVRANGWMSSNGKPSPSSGILQGGP